MGTKKLNKKVANFLTDNNNFRKKFMTMSEHEQMLAIGILKQILK